MLKPGEAEGGGDAEARRGVHERCRRAEAEHAVDVVAWPVDGEAHGLGAGPVRHRDAVVREPGQQPAPQHGDGEPRTAGQRGLLEQHLTTADGDAVEERGPARLAVVRAPVHEQRLPGGHQRRGRLLGHDDAEGGLLGRDRRAGTGPPPGRAVQGLPPPRRVDDDGCRERAPALERDPSGAGRPADPAGVHLDPGQLRVQVGPQGLDVEHGVLPAEVVGADRDGATPRPGGDRRLGDAGGQLVRPAPVRRREGAVELRVGERGAQAGSRARSGERPARGAAADDEDVRAHAPTLTGATTAAVRGRG